ncbi:hypothetical protein SY83_00655 [Paenibacillus swuensis]|uniref:Phage shock protein PspC N-terminal domain-containing protein n=1 Tax=Paenibacillus swuensis TaxID=1178515 RepID=A0A172TDN5_9BACL|nr:PspC domain-containing protein [Paenibacillus swuensis]ANE45111.1 hypothetical protein SY83_00655 [Paenibacillus swuensis]
MKKLYRSQRDKKLFGIAGGLAELFHIDATLLRLLFVITAFFSGGVIIPIYILAALVIPKEFDVPHGPFGRDPFQPGWANACGGHVKQNQHAQYGQHAQHAQYGQQGQYGQQQTPSNTIDEMMKDVERKAMWKEIEELRAKVAKYEKGEV